MHVLNDPAAWIVCGLILLLLYWYIDADVEAAQRRVVEELEVGVGQQFLPRHRDAFNAGFLS